MEGDLEVILGTRASNGVTTLNGQTGERINQFSWNPQGSDTLLLLTEPPQPPSVFDLGKDDTLEVVIGRVTDKGAGSYTPITKLGVAYRGEESPIRKVSTAQDEIPIPGRRDVEFPATIGDPIVLDLDGDGSTVEILASSTQGGLFCWETFWDSDADSFVTTAKKGWPMVFPETPGTPAVADLDGDGKAELVVAAGDYVHVFDLPGSASGILWSTAGHDVQRTGDASGGSAGEGSLAQWGAPVMAFTGGPNPFNPVTRLRFGVTQPETVHLAIYDVTGRRVRTLREEILRAGVYEDVWDGRNESGTAMASGIYFARLKVGEAETVRKLVVAK